MYSWAEPERSRVMAQPLGALLYFLDEPPRGLGVRDFGRYALTLVVRERARLGL